MNIAKTSFALIFVSLVGGVAACSSAPGDETSSTNEGWATIGNYCAVDTSAITPEVWDGHTKLWALGSDGSDDIPDFLWNEPKVESETLPNQVWGTYVAVAAVEGPTGKVMRIVWVEECDLEAFGQINPDAVSGFFPTGTPPCPSPAPSPTRCPSGSGVPTTGGTSNTILRPSWAPPHVPDVPCALITRATTHYKQHVCLTQ